jgi:hypothetical protein
MAGNETNGRYHESNGNGKFALGNPGKPPGAVVKSTTKIKKAIADFLELNIDKVQESFDQLKPVEKLQFITAILPYAVPKMSSSEIDKSVKKEIIVRWDPSLLPSQTIDLPPQE